MGYTVMFELSIFLSQPCLEIFKKKSCTLEKVDIDRKPSTDFWSHEISQKWDVVIQFFMFTYEILGKFFSTTPVLDTFYVNISNYSGSTKTFKLILKNIS